MTPEARQRRRIRTPVLAITAMAWAATLAVHALPSGSGDGMAGMPGMAGMDSTAAWRSSNATGRNAADLGSPLALLTGWPLMLIAMMAPLLIRALRHVYARSLPRRRWRAVTLLTAAYAATWSAGWLLLLAVATAVQAAVPQTGAAVALGLCTAVAWQLSPAKQRCLNRHHAHPPIAAFGRTADADALQFGCRHALWCFGSCAPLMLLPLLSGGWQLTAMAVVALWIWAESFDTPAAPSWRLRLPVRAGRIIGATSRSVLQLG
jgi:predicted metal-binding membrane protein